MQFDRSVAAPGLDRNEAAADATCPGSPTREPLAATTSEEIHLPLIAEELHAVTHATRTGPVRVQRRFVDTALASDNVDDANEILVSRRVVTRTGTDGARIPYEQIVIEIPLPVGADAADLVVNGAEEIIVTHEIVRRTEQITGYVRRDDVTVTTSGSVGHAPLGAVDPAPSTA